MNGIRNHSVIHPDSVLLCQPIDGGKELQQDLVQCCHCGRHWLIGDAIARNLKGIDPLGYCSLCDGVHCPAKQCHTCRPWEQYLDNVEAGFPVDYLPISVSMPANCHQWKVRADG